MKPVDSPAMRVSPWAVLGLTIGIIAFDLLTPVGVAVSILYVIPLLLTFFSPRKRDLIYFSIVATAFIWIGLIFKPSGIPVPYGMFNRTLGTLVLWGVALGLIYHKRMQEGLISTEGALKTAQERFEDIIEASKDAIGYAGFDGTIFLVNRAFSKLTGFSREELLRMNVRDLIPEQHKKQRDRVVAQVLQTGEPAEYEIDYLRKNGSLVPVSISLSTVKGEGGKPTGLAAIIRDLTERKGAEEQFRLVVESSPSGMLMVDKSGIILLVNRQIEQQFGYERAELIGQPVEMLVPQRMRSHHAGDRAEFMTHSESRAMGKGRDLFGVRKDGTEFPLEIGLNPVQTPKEMRVLASVVDISERKHIQEQLRKAERLAELGTLASGMAHEIGTPMNVILGRAEYLLQRTADEGMKKGLATIVAQIERITKVMNQLLAFARRRTPERRAVDLGQVLEDSLEMFQERIARSRITVDKTIEANLPPVQADQDQLMQVLINLVMNSLHAMPEGGRLRLSLAHEGSHLCLGVSDTGHGIPEEICAKVFEPFFTTKDFGKGTGLGLTVVKGIVEEHGGTITLESVAEKGTTFTIRLPVERAETAAKPSSREF